MIRAQTRSTASYLSTTLVHPTAYDTEVDCVRSYGKPTRLFPTIDNHAFGDDLNPRSRRHYRDKGTVWVNRIRALPRPIRCETGNTPFQVINLSEAALPIDNLDDRTYHLFQLAYITRLPNWNRRRRTGSRKEHPISALQCLIRAFRFFGLGLCLSPRRSLIQSASDLWPI